MLTTKQIEKLLRIIDNTLHIEIDGKLLETWGIDMGAIGVNDIVFWGSHYDSDGNGFQWDFCINNFKSAKVTDHIITLNDMEGELSVIGLYMVIPKKIELE